MDQTKAELLSKLIREHHEYARHACTSVVTWLALHMTVSFAGLGWLATTKLSYSDDGKNRYMLVLASVALLVANALTLVFIQKVKSYYCSLQSRLLQYNSLIYLTKPEQSNNIDKGVLDRLKDDVCVPVEGYLACLRLLQAGVAVLLLIWLAVPFVILSK